VGAHGDCEEEYGKGQALHRRMVLP
jgi:hypothetical protein